MIRLVGAIRQTTLIPSEGAGEALVLDITSDGDEVARVSGIFLARKGINAFPEFAEGFGLDASSVVCGLPPEEYQIRTEMLLSYKSELCFGDRKSELVLAPSKRVTFVLPLPFRGMDYFLNSPPEDLFFVANNLGDASVIIESENPHAHMVKILASSGGVGMDFTVRFTIHVPQLPGTEHDADGIVGTTNTKPIGPMPNT